MSQVAAIGIGAAMALIGCADEECDFNEVTRDVGGIGLMDCGIAAADDPSAVDRCAVMAHGQGAIFRAIYETDEGGLEAILHTAQDTYALVRTPADARVIEQAGCDSGQVVTEGGRTRVQCVNPGPFAVVCE